MRNRLFGPLSLSIVVVLAACAADPSPYAQTTGGGDAPVAKGETHRFAFDEAASVPARFEAILGDWKVEPAADAPSPGNVLAQRGEFVSPDFPRIVVRDLTFTNAHVKVRCAMLDGDIDQACGLMFRFRDSDNYYVTRANAREGNVRLYRVVAGERQQFGTHDVPVAAGSWHTLEAEAHGDVLKVIWDGQEIMSERDTTFTRGKVGLWTKADSRTAFDDFEATEL
jgi:hypothetical protein